MRNLPICVCVCFFLCCGYNSCVVLFLCVSFCFVLFCLCVSAAASATPVTRHGEGGGQRWGHAVPTVLVQPAGRDLRDPAGLPVLRLLGVVLG